MRNFGAVDPSLYTVTDMQINDFKDQLISQYKLKTELLADRELARFKYVSSWRTRFERSLERATDDLLNYASNTMDSLLNAAIANTWKNLKTNLKQIIPLITINGNWIYDETYGFPAYMMDPNSFGAVAPAGQQATLISPIDNLLVLNDYNYGGEPAPIYKTQRARFEQGILTQGYGGQNVVFRFRSKLTSMYSIEAPFTENNLPDVELTNYLGNASYVPISGEVAKEFAKLFSTNYGNGSINDLLIEGKSLYLDLLDRTMKVVRQQIYIDKLEDDIVEFINKVKGQDVSHINTADLLKQLQDLSALSNSPAGTPEAQVVAAAAPASKSSLWMILAGAGIYLATKDS